MTNTEKKNGYYIAHMKSGNSHVVLFIEDAPYPGNLDGVDPASFDKMFLLNGDAIEALEPISEPRLAVMRELTIRKFRTADVQSIVNLKDWIQAGVERKVFQEDGAVAPQQPPQAAQPSQPIKPQLMQVEPNKQQPIVQPAKGPQLVKPQSGDARVVKVPKPGNK